MPNGQTGLPLTAPPGGGAPFVSTGKKGGIDLDQVLPLLLLVSPLLELRSPGSGMGLAAGIVGYQKEKQEKRRRDSMGLLQMLSEIDDDQIETAIGALADAGYDPQLVKAMAKASRGMVDPGRKAERALNQLVEDPNLGLIPRKTQIDVQARELGRKREEEADVTRRAREAEEKRAAVTQEPTLGELGVPVPPWLASRKPSEVKAMGIDIDKLLPKEPQAVVVVDNQGNVVSAFPVPSGSRVVQVSPPRPDQPKRYAVIDPRSGKVVAEGELPPGTQVVIQPRPVGEGGGTVGGAVPGAATFGAWEVLPPATKAGESRYRNRETGQVLSRAGALGVLQRTSDPDLARALGVPRPTTPAAAAFDKSRVEQQKARVKRVAEIRKRMNQLRALNDKQGLEDSEEAEYRTLAEELAALTQIRFHTRGR